MDDTYSIPGLPKQNQVPFLGDPEMMFFLFFFTPYLCSSRYLTEYLIQTYRPLYTVAIMLICSDVGWCSKFSD